MRFSEGLDSCQGSLIWHQHEVTWEQGPIRALVSFTLQRNLCVSMCRAQILGYSLRLAAPFRLTSWFHIHLFYSSEPTPRSLQEIHSTLKHKGKTLKYYLSTLDNQSLQSSKLPTPVSQQGVRASFGHPKSPLSRLRTPIHPIT